LAARLSGRPDLHPRTAPDWPPTGRGTLLALSVEQLRVRGCLLEAIAGSYRLAAWLTVPRWGERHLADQVAALCRQLGNRLGRRLWDDDAHAPLLQSADPTRHPPIGQLAVTLSPRPPLQVWIAGLTGGYSLEAARLAVSGSAAYLAGVTSLAVESSPEMLAQALAQARPDVLVLVGGYDLPQAVAPVLHLTALVAAGLHTLPRRQRPSVLFAGNRWAVEQAEPLLRGMEGLTVATAPNVLPSPARLQPGVVARALDEHYWRLCRRLDGFALLEQWSTGPGSMATVEENFARLVQTWLALHNLAELHALYCGERWVHVWAVEGEPAPLIAYADPDPAQVALAGWPPVTLLSGSWPELASVPPGVRWWDRNGFAPVVAALGPVAPAALFQVLSHDLLVSTP
jgi:hypothetical protein